MMSGMILSSMSPVGNPQCPPSTLLLNPSPLLPPPPPPTHSIHLVTTFFLIAIHLFQQSCKCQQIPREGGPAPSTKGRIESPTPLPPPLHKKQNNNKNYSHSVNEFPSRHSSPLDVRPPMCSPLLLQPLAFPQRPCSPPRCTPVCLSNLGQPAQKAAR